MKTKTNKPGKELQILITGVTLVFIFLLSLVATGETLQNDDKDFRLEDCDKDNVNFYKEYDKESLKNLDYEVLEDTVKTEEGQLRNRYTRQITIENTADYEGQFRFRHIWSTKTSSEKNYQQENLAIGQIKTFNSSIVTAYPLDQIDSKVSYLQGRTIVNETIKENIREEVCK